MAHSGIANRVLQHNSYSPHAEQWQDTSRVPIVLTAHSPDTQSVDVALIAFEGSPYRESLYVASIWEA